MLNHITIMGRLTRDPELRYTQTNTAVTSFTLAVDRDFAPKDGGERVTDFIDVVAWRQTGEFVSKYFSKGKMAAVSGRLQIRDWTDKDGNKRKTAEILADSVYFGESRNGADTKPKPAGRGVDVNADDFEVMRFKVPAGNASSFSELSDETGELPF
ncbi:MAG: single-stranded DNA-binding protein, partial [Oscillospiraceae bacterium]